MTIVAGPITVDCPTCGALTAYSPRNAWRPFCSERCRGVDLGAWASERFRIAGVGNEADGEDAARPDSPPAPAGG